MQLKLLFPIITITNEVINGKNNTGIVVLCSFKKLKVKNKTRKSFGTAENNPFQY